MAAYAALVSVMQIIDQIEHHPRPPISLDKKQVESLTKNVTFLQEFLESYPHIGENEEGQAMESRIADAAFAAEDVIESHVVDEILVESTNRGQNTGLFCQRLQKVIEDMEDLIKNEVMEIKEKMGVRVQHHQLQRSSASHSSTMVGFDEALLEILDKLVGEKDGRKIIPITGMGGIGKTTLATNVYQHPLIKERFDIRAWVTVSQEYNVKLILSELLCQAKQIKEVSSEMNEHDEIGENLYQYLCGRKYLIILDDIWNIEAWNKIKFFFPEIKNGSRIVVTTRLSNLARDLTNSHGLAMKLLGMDESWELFSKIVFAEEGCPPELEKIGKKIVTNCRGLPLSIAVIGGFMAKSECEREQWEHIEANMSSIVNSENDDYCLKILQLSYNQLPVHLKPCFLYMGVFEEDSETQISKLVRLWVAEGFVKPIIGKELEEVGKEYLKDLVDRNLVSITTTRIGNIKSVKIHDLLRDLCWRQAQTERFYSVQGPKRRVDTQSRRLILSGSVEEKDDVLLSMSHARSIVTHFQNVVTLPPDYRLLRIFGACDESLRINKKDEFVQVNLRYLSIVCYGLNSKFAASFHLLWNLQTILIEVLPGYCFNPPAEIWSMRQLRHVMVNPYLLLPDPPACNGPIDDVLENLQTLITVEDFKCSQEVIKRIPNIKKLAIHYEGKVVETCLNNLDRLNKLESFSCRYFPDPEPDGSGFLQSLTFPESLKKLSLGSNHGHWEDILGKIGSLPLLHKLQILGARFRTGKWETVEGHFSSLRLLDIKYCRGLEEWISESSHFPRLEKLVLWGLEELHEIPWGIGEIATMQSIELLECSTSAVVSAKRILEEQEELYGEEEVGLRLIVNLESSEETSNILLYN